MVSTVGTSFIALPTSSSSAVGGSVVVVVVVVLVVVVLVLLVLVVVVVARGREVVDDSSLTGAVGASSGAGEVELPSCSVTEAASDRASSTNSGLTKASTTATLTNTASAMRIRDGFEYIVISHEEMYLARTLGATWHSSLADSLDDLKL